MEYVGEVRVKCVTGVKCQSGAKRRYGLIALRVDGAETHRRRPRCLSQGACSRWAGVKDSAEAGHLRWDARRLGARDNRQNRQSPRLTSEAELLTAQGSEQVGKSGRTHVGGFNGRGRECE